MARIDRRLMKIAALPSQMAAADWLDTFGDDARRVLDDAGPLADQLVTHIVGNRAYRPSIAEIRSDLATVRQHQAASRPMATTCDRCSHGLREVIAARCEASRQPADYGRMRVTVATSWAACDCPRGQQMRAEVARWRVAADALRREGVVSEERRGALWGYWIQGTDRPGVDGRRALLRQCAEWNGEPLTGRFQTLAERWINESRVEPSSRPTVSWYDRGSAEDL